MARLITPAYTFTPGSSQINLSGISGFDIRALTGIVNLTTGAVVYARGVAGYGFSAIAGSLLTLQAPMAGMSAGDSLAIKYDDGGLLATDAAVTAITAALGADGSSPPTLPGGSNGVRGWLRGILAALSGTLTVAQTIGGNPLSSSNRMPVDLPTGLAQDGADATGVASPTGGSGIRGWLSGIYGKLPTLVSGALPTLDPNNAPFTTANPMTSGATVAAAKSVGINCTAAGSIVLTLSGGGTIALPVGLGWQTFPFAATQFAFSGGAGGAVYNLA